MIHIKDFVSVVLPVRVKWVTQTPDGSEIDDASKLPEFPLAMAVLNTPENP